MNTFLDSWNESKIDGSCIKSFLVSFSGGKYASKRGSMPLSMRAKKLLETLDLLPG